MLSDFPLTFAINLQPGRINHQVGDSPWLGNRYLTSTVLACLLMLL